VDVTGDRGACVVAIVWWIVEPGYEPLLAVLAGVAALMGSFTGETQETPEGDHQEAPSARIPLQRPARAEHFTDRAEELTKLLEDLRPGRATTLCGPGGIGKSALAGRKALLFLDGTEQVDDLQAVLDVRGGCGVLITSRTSRDAEVDWEELSPLPPDQAVGLLEAWAGERAEGPETASEICKLVGRLP